MRLTRLTPHPALQSYIEKFWIFESDQSVSDEDLKLIVPNGLTKITIPFKNGLTSVMNGKKHISRETTITLIGIADIPAIVDDEHDGPSGTIGIEFNPVGAYRFFGLSQYEISNNVFALSDVLGSKVRELQDRISDAANNEQRIKLIEHFLISQLAKREPDDILDYCLQEIIYAKGRIQVSALEKYTGYTSRWLNMKFREKVGVSPKTFASILRFQQFYQAWARNNEKQFFRKEFYEYYYDQSHFIKEFKRYTGLAPTKFQIQENEFGRIFYRD